ncbi:MAG: cell division protein ZapD [Nevskiaceae bacterium]|nr:MAG: cell division protein ZapD [Nevskiaceae bacterium]
MTQGAESVAFEQPLTERVRTFLRLEFLFAQHRHAREDHSSLGVRATLQSLLDILTVLSRSDLKNDILKELADQHTALTRLAARPGIDGSRLQAILGEITEALSGMQQLATQFAGSLLRGNDFLTAVLNRSGIPGGTCAFDLPAFHFWLSQPHERIRRDLDAWFADIRPFEKAINLYLRLLRNSVEPESRVAHGGMYVHTPQGPCVLVRVTVPLAAHVYPEISAGRHRFTVRFMNANDVNVRSQQAAADISFLMQCCTL